MCYSLRNNNSELFFRGEKTMSGTAGAPCQSLIEPSFSPDVQVINCTSPLPPTVYECVLLGELEGL